ncbi:MAG: hypothetical protein IPL79_17455 [Myxococcales bacterium]|nr:hypothetical protein [Myxococcales bacterium]
MKLRRIVLTALYALALCGAAVACKKVEDTRAVTETWVRGFGAWNEQFTELKAASEAASARMAAIAKPLQATSKAGLAYQTATDMVTALTATLDGARGLLDKFAGMFNDAKTQGKVAGIASVQTEANAALPPALKSATEAIAKTIVAVEAAEIAAAAEAQSPVAKIARSGGSSTTGLFAPGTATMRTPEEARQHGPNQLSAADIVALANSCSEIRLTITHVAATQAVADAQVAAFKQFLSD